MYLFDDALKTRGIKYSNVETWFLLAPPQSKFMATPLGVNKLQGGASRYALYNMESLIKKFTNKYIFFYNLLNVRGA